MSPSIWQLLLVVVVIFVVFGAGKLPNVMSDLGKGIRNLKKGLKEDDQPESSDFKSVENKDSEKINK
jgi:sec-independent protein translocase protein TatA